MQILAYLQMYQFRIVHVFWTARGCVDGVSFHALLRSETEFRHNLPALLWIDVLVGIVYCLENNREVTPKLCIELE